MLNDSEDEFNLDHDYFESDIEMDSDDHLSDDMYQMMIKLEIVLLVSHVMCQVNLI